MFLHSNTFSQNAYCHVLIRGHMHLLACYISHIETHVFDCYIILKYPYICSEHIYPLIALAAMTHIYIRKPIKLIIRYLTQIRLLDYKLTLRVMIALSKQTQPLHTTRAHIHGSISHVLYTIHVTDIHAG